MILRRYGSRLQSVELNFDPKALNEIAFRRDHATAFDAEEFATSHERRETHSLAAEAEGDVHTEVEQAVLHDLERQVRAVLEALAPGEVAVIENEQGSDWPKTRQVTRNVVLEGENRLHFRVSVDPALEIGVYRPRA